MDVRLDRAALAEAALWVSQVIAKNPESINLAGMHVRAHDGGVTLTGFDNLTSHSATITGAVSKAGEVIVPGRVLSQIVAAMGSADVHIEVRDSLMTVTSGRSTYRIRTYSAKNFPHLPEFPKHVGRIDADRLAEATGAVAHAVSKNDLLGALAAYNFRGDAGHLTVTSTDRYRLARATALWSDASASEFEANVPGVALSTSLRGFSGEVEMGVSETLFGLRDESRAIVTRLLGSEHEFPPKVPAVFARPSLISVEIEVAPLVEALKRARLAVDESGAIVVAFSDGLVEIAADGAASDGTEEVDCETGHGEGSTSFKFTASHLLDALAACTTSRVTFGLSAPGQQVNINPVGDPSVALICMPRRA